MKKRQFLKRLGQAAMVTPFLSMDLQAQEAIEFGKYPKDDEAFWQRIRKDYQLKPDYINLENGYYNFIPQPIMKKYIGHLQMVNYEASYYMRTVQWQNKAKVRDRLAALVGSTSKELIITRNTTESLDLIIGGYPWKKNDEAIYAMQDYGSMKDHFQLMAKKYGMVNIVISVPNHPKSDEEIVTLYEEQITENTKLIMISHMINITGHILPVRKICDMAHRHGVEVLVDGAHCIGHFPVDIKALGCDYYGSSLHKWLSVPLGSGMLHVSENKIKKIWPIFADYTDDTNEIQRLNHTGTIPVHTDLAIADAIDYLEIIGLERKAQRMQYLQKYWSNQVRDVKNVRVNTPVDVQRSCGIANVGIENIKPADLAKSFLDEFKVFTVAIDYANVQGCRITPNVYTSLKELDAFVDAIKTLAARA